ncbi:hypothetical protein DY000_02045841 [Brassica cretica]|uniref:Uncharacterized protein n=1 Tax=Brassica cretica TaxID=69181 RepID=A0ABQ7F1N0_BRACR|nr:hypothetical protein DY000_02045841 [Brassica cretica]
MPKTIVNVVFFGNFPLFFDVLVLLVDGSLGFVVLVSPAILLPPQLQWALAKLFWRLASISLWVQPLCILRVVVLHVDLWDNVSLLWV